MRRFRLVQWLIVIVVAAAGALVPATGATGADTTVQSEGAGRAVRVAASDATGLTFEVSVPWQRLIAESAPEGSYVQVSMPGWVVTSQPGAPALPFIARAVGAPFGATVNVQTEAGPAHRIALSGPVMPAATQQIEWVPTADADAGPALPAVNELVLEDPSIYGGVAAYPDALAQVFSDGVVRQQRVAGIVLYPVQYSPVAQELTVYEWLRVTVTFGAADTGGRLAPGASRSIDLIGAPAESTIYEELLGQELLNYQTARAWRQASLPHPGLETGAEARSGALEWGVEGAEIYTGAIAGAAGASSLSTTTPWTPPSPGWRVKVRDEGLYRLTYPELQAAGLPVATLDPRTLRLYNLGSEVAIYVEGENDGSFGQNDSVLFYGQAVTSKYTRDNVYWLTYGGAYGLRMATRDGTPGSATVADHHGATLRMETNTHYVMNVPGVDAFERWMWDYLYAPSKPSWTHTFSLAAPYGGNYPEARLKVAMLGFHQRAPNPDHHAQVYLNNALVADVTWDGFTWNVIDVPISQSQLIAGSNSLTVVAPNDLGVGQDVIYLDWAEIRFADTFRAEGDRLAFGFDVAGSWQFQVGGFSSNQVAVYDISKPGAPVRVTGVAVDKPDKTYAARFQDMLAAPARYWTTATSGFRSVQAIESDTASSLGAASNGADYIVIAHKDFLAQAAQLSTFRASQGLRAVLVDVQDVYDEFGYGITGAEPIHHFLAHTYGSWQAPAPSYVTLVGDGHYDPKDFYGTGLTSYIPPYLALADPWLGETAADNRYVTLTDSDTMPDMMLGRLSVNSAAEASAAVGNILAYEQLGPEAWQQQVLMVADNTDAAGSFPAMSDSILECCLTSQYQATKVYYGSTHLTLAGVRSAIQAGINAGTLIVNYTGHGAPDQWADEGFLDIADMPLLQNGTKLPVILSMTCYDGFYHRPFSVENEALAEVVTRASGKGAVASWSPTGLGIATGHAYLDRGFFEAVFTDQDGVITVGAATLAGKLRLWTTGANLDLLDTYLLFGDPATTIALPGGVVPAPTATPVAPTATPLPTIAPTATVAPLPAMHLGDIGITFTLRKGTYTVTASTKVLDAAGKSVASAQVYGQWILPSGTTTSPQVLTTGKTGAVSFTLTNTMKGTYRFCVANVAKTGWTYDSGANLETCDSLTTP